MRRIRLFAAVIAMACAASALHAQIGVGSIATQIQNWQKNFDAADTNHDGMLTKEEAQKGPVPFIREHFDEIDKQHRGMVSKQDVSDYVRAMQGAGPAKASTSR
ncbi:EF-hand domain-containing protein [Dyella solisilvae]|uniref:EF-hand domain-containing protein n=1 Tax=Dyella solisilvae TaxID=1920168 RepID=A0A370K886_9GAMM|nr:EF-hand domain-containing protein [Dyella solisilvae]RDI98843.1 EF-hand domain-containing protein [Dyella solisilvae]